MPASNPREVPGNNSVPDVAGGQLTSFVERIERLAEDKKQVGEDIKDVFAEAKGTGFDVKVIRAIVARRKADKDKQAEFEELLDLYERAMERAGT